MENPRGAALFHPWIPATDRHHDRVTDERPRRSLSAIQILLFALAAMVVLFGVAMFLAWCAAADEGTYPDWLAALATLAAFGAAVIAGWYAHRALLVEQARDGRREEDDRERARRDLRQQAEKVAAWSGPLSTSKSNGVVDRVNLDLAIRNASDLPITEVLIQLTARLAPSTGNPRDASLMTLDSLRRHLVPPAVAAQELTAPRALRDLVGDVLNQNPTHTLTILVELQFTDAANRRWIRRSDGTLLADGTA